MSTEQHPDPRPAPWPRQAEAEKRFRLLRREKAKTSQLGQSQWRIAGRMLRQNSTAMLGLGGLVLLVLSAILSPWLAPYDPISFDRDHLLDSPSTTHLWGTDRLGRDILSRVLWGGRESLRVSVLAVSVGLGFGTVFGLISGFYGGWVDVVIQRLVEIFMAFPSILLVLSIVAALGPSLSTVLIALGISSIPGYTRLVRGSVLAARNMEYVVAAQVVGAPYWRIMFRHILPNVISPIIVFSTLGVGGAIRVGAGLSYLGLGAQPPSPEWGAMLNAGRGLMYDAWWMSVFPGLAIFVAVLCVNLLGDGLRDALDPRLRI